MKKFILDITREAGLATKKYFKKEKIGVRVKTHMLDLLTEADLKSNKIIVGAIQKYYPDHGIISEETHEYNADADYVWIIDPVDGTINFARGLPLYVVMVALAYKGVVVLAAVYDPIHDQMYFAEKGKGAFLNGKKIKCSAHNNISGSMVFLAGVDNPKMWPFFANLQKYRESDAKWMASAFNSIGYGAMTVATGQKDFMVTDFGGGVWDYAAAFLILKESGCMVTNRDGKPWTLKDRNMVAANKILHKKIMKCLK